MMALTTGVTLWVLAHAFKRLAPSLRSSMGQRGKALVTGLLVLAIILMVQGYRNAEPTILWSLPSWAVHLNNLLMVSAVLLFGMSATTGRLRGKLRHPMLWSVVVWSIAHLLVNGDLASLILFGGMGVWALLQMQLINQSETWDRPAPGDAKKDALLVVITLVAFGIMTGAHIALGVWPFGGQ